jgi:lactoylglutathione lyase
MQLALNVDDLDEAITFYSKLFNTTPAKAKPGYANFAVAEPPLKLVLMENPGKGGTINHLGVEVESSDTVHEEIARLTAEGLFTEEEINTTCCFARQDKVWVTGPAGEKWEIYTVLAHSETFGTSPQHLDSDRPDPAAQPPQTDDHGDVCCGGSPVAAAGVKPASACCR